MGEKPTGADGSVSLDLKVYGKLEEPTERGRGENSRILSEQQKILSYQFQSVFWYND